MSDHDSDAQQPGTISLADEEAVKQIVASTVFGLWDIVNNLTRLRPTRHERYRVTVFGSARAKPGTYVYDEVIHETPLILIGQMWADLVEWARVNLLRPELPLASPEDITIPQCVGSVDEAMALLTAHHTRWLQSQTTLQPSE